MRTMQYSSLWLPEQILPFGPISEVQSSPPASEPPSGTLLLVPIELNRIMLFYNPLQPENVFLQPYPALGTIGPLSKLRLS